jgi:YegS/Rv2252/BmrU family lipid kinase
MPDNPFFVVNPHSADGRTLQRWEELRDELRRRNLEPRFELTRGTMHAAELAAAAIEGGADLVVAVGGDGTLNEVLNGYFRATRQPPRGAALGYLPSGTGSDFARTLGLFGLSPAQQVEKLAGGSLRLLDCGQVRFTGTGPGGEPQETSRLFLNESSLGFSAETVNNVNRASKRFGGKASFLLGVLRTLTRLRNPLLQVTVDGMEVYEGPTLLVAVANGKYFGGSMMIAPMADLQDGEFDVVVVSAMSRLTLLKKIGKIYRGEHLAEPEVHVHRGAEVRINSVGQEVLLEMDGEQPGRLSADYHISRHTVPFLA